MVLGCSIISPFISLWKTTKWIKKMNLEHVVVLYVHTALEGPIPHIQTRSSCSDDVLHSLYVDGLYKSTAALLPCHLLLSTFTSVQADLLVAHCWDNHAYEHTFGSLTVLYLGWQMSAYMLAHTIIAPRSVTAPHLYTCSYYCHSSISYI